MAEKNEQNTERRVVVSEDVELRIESDGDGPGTMTGYAARFNKDSVDLGGFIERIKQGAFTDALKDADVRGLKNHDPNLLLGRTTAGTLKLEENGIGLKFKLSLPNTTAGRDVAEEVKRGDITGCSFSFRLAKEGGDEWHEKDGLIKRTIHKIAKIFDVGPVAFPAYPDTTVAVRSLDEFRKVEPTVPPEGEPAEVPTTDEMQESIDASRTSVLDREKENDVMRHMPLQVIPDEKK